MLALTPVGGDTTQTKVEMTLPPAGGDVTEGHLKWMRHFCAVEGRARAKSPRNLAMSSRPRWFSAFMRLFELELMRRAAKLSVAHRPRAGSPIAIPDGTLDGSGDVAIVSAPLDGLLARPIGQPFAFAIALEEELEAHAHDPLEVAVWEFVRERGARLLHLAPGTRSRTRADASSRKALRRPSATCRIPDRDPRRHA